ncbi:hypothetical protein DPMN_039335 [Dreissena polymorpha]|uniref:Uncharacterized protein n=1 Tax=Dreissena polymorpha TaxID=45954 RepID=A0A9D4MH45_DREPO|nr:hypothetical protein DPMN_039335 [Dreissena polymorpha]
MEEEVVVAQMTPIVGMEIAGKEIIKSGEDGHLGNQSNKIEVLFHCGRKGVVLKVKASRECKKIILEAAYHKLVTKLHSTGGQELEHHTILVELVEEVEKWRGYDGNTAGVLRCTGLGLHDDSKETTSVVWQTMWKRQQERLMDLNKKMLWRQDQEIFLT